MGTGGYKIRNKAAVHFITFAVVDWLDVFTRPVYQDIVLDSLRHCQKNRGLVLNAWCLMTNHLHLIGSAKNHDLSEILRDFKCFTANQVILAIQQNYLESRKEWMMPIFRKHGLANSRNKENQFWRQDNQPKECFSIPFTMQKINYIHFNPVLAGTVIKPEHYRLSSAVDFAAGKNCGLLDVDLLLSNLKEYNSSS